MARSSAAQTDFEELRSDNCHLNTTVSELRLEIAYYQGETKRLEWEKNLLKQDVSKMSALFKGWLSELQNSNTRSVLDDSDFFTNLVKYPSKNISDVLQMSDAKLLITTCQAPFYIEYTNKAWTEECGWDSHEVIGLTCAFLQGELTDIKTAAAFTKDVKEVGYGNMRINNYRKNGEVFNASITVFPVYDSVVTGEVPVLTHFATLMSDVRNITLNDIAQSSVPSSVSKILNGNITASYKTSFTNCISSSAATETPSPDSSSVEIQSLPQQHQQSSPPPTQTQTQYVSPVIPASFNWRVCDRRVQSRRFDAECRLTAENFEKSAAAVRISDLLRLMLTCVDAMVLMDKSSKIIHCNRQWVELTGYKLSEVEGLDCSVLHGSMTDRAAVMRCAALTKQNKPSSMSVVNYRRDGSMFVNQVSTSPIRGGFKTKDVTHFCSLLLPQRPEFTDFEALLRLNNSCFRSSKRVGSSGDESPLSSLNTSKRQICDVNSFDCEGSDSEDNISPGFKTPKMDELDYIRPEGEDTYSRCRSISRSYSNSSSHACISRLTSESENEK